MPTSATPTTRTTKKPEKLSCESLEENILINAVCTYQDSIACITQLPVKQAIQVHPTWVTYCKYGNRGTHNTALPSLPFSCIRAGCKKMDRDKNEAGHQKHDPKREDWLKTGKWTSPKTKKKTQKTKTFARWNILWRRRKDKPETRRKYWKTTNPTKDCT